jgi:hypothetical protein
MTRKTSPEVPAAIRARLAYLHSRKAALDELIYCMERYKSYLSPGRKPSTCPRLIKSVHVNTVRQRPLRRLAGAA